MSNHKVWHQIPTKVYQALHPEHFSRSCVERRAGAARHRWWGALCYPNQLNSLTIKYGKPTKPCWRGREPEKRMV
jgi:hypothetical protein